MIYNEIFEFAEKNNLLINGKLRGKSKLRKKSLENMIQLEHMIINATSFLKSNDIKLRWIYLKEGITQKNYKCPVCGEPRIKNRGMSKIGTTCGKKDTKHLKFINFKKSELSASKKTN